MCVIVSVSQFSETRKKNLFNKSRDQYSLTQCLLIVLLNGPFEKIESRLFSCSAAGDRYRPDIIYIPSPVAHRIDWNFTSRLLCIRFAKYHPMRIIKNKNCVSNANGVGGYQIRNSDVHKQHFKQKLLKLKW